MRYVEDFINEINNDLRIIFGLFYEHMGEFLQRALDNIFFINSLFVINKIIYLLFYFYFFYY